MSGLCVSNKELLPAVLASKSAGCVSESLSAMIHKLVDQFATKYPDQPHLDAMIKTATNQVHKSILYFNPDKSNNPLAFASVIIKCSFCRSIALTKRDETTAGLRAITVPPPATVYIPLKS